MLILRANDFSPFIVVSLFAFEKQNLKDQLYSFYFNVQGRMFSKKTKHLQRWISNLSSGTLISIKCIKSIGWLAALADFVFCFMNTGFRLDSCFTLLPQAEKGKVSFMDDNKVI